MRALERVGEEARIEVWQHAEKGGGTAAEGFQGWLVELVEDHKEELVGEVEKRDVKVGPVSVLVASSGGSLDLGIGLKCW